MRCTQNTESFIPKMAVFNFFMRILLFTKVVQCFAFPSINPLPKTFSSYHQPRPYNTLTRHNAISGLDLSLAKQAFASTGVQKVLELSVITAIGTRLQKKLDSKAVSALLLNGLVPAVIVNSLSSIKPSAELGGVIAAGVALSTTQMVASHLASKLVLRDNGSTTSPADLKRRNALRRTATLELGTAASALSVFSFTREFVGIQWQGLAALGDLPAKCVILFLLPSLLKAFGDPEGKQISTINPITDSESALNPISDAESSSSSTTILNKVSSIFQDPFNIAIITGLTLAITGTPVDKLGFFGSAMKSLASAQTPVLFLLIGLKLKFDGAAPALCGSLLFARHGFIALITSAFLSFFLPLIPNQSEAMMITRNAARLCATLSSQAACSVIAYGQINKIEKSNPKLGYNSDLAFDLVALSFPLAIVLNTFACLGGASYVDNLTLIGMGLLGLSSLLYASQKKVIDAL